ncbi:hypothetical protein OH76DRAFT_1084530 [Lentinus brumalis]|uniref:Uncharacterized protein n=1 Tax=Lentinus brumalis TaxID=2498619 RepID=A0A371DPA4_9APHY|nr:hypothetical protein OH76DRAFT_1084530 [Polyporus brumalis]
MTVPLRLLIALPLHAPHTLSQRSSPARSLSTSHRSYLPSFTSPLHVSHLSTSAYLAHMPSRDCPTTQKPCFFLILHSLLQIMLDSAACDRCCLPPRLSNDASYLFDLLSLSRISTQSRTRISPHIIIISHISHIPPTPALILLRITCENILRARATSNAIASTGSLARAVLPLPKTSRRASS